MIQEYMHHLERKNGLPQLHAAFLQTSLPRLQADERIVAVAAAGSFLTGDIDEYSDLDLVIVVEPAAAPQIMQERREIAAPLGPLLAAFTGEHVGEPRLLICLYGPPLLHVDLKFVSLSDAACRCEDPVILWERAGRLTAMFRQAAAVAPTPDLQWLEDRFWVWVHYVAAKIGRGELMETLDALAFLRRLVLGPLALHAQGCPPAGVRKVETRAKPYVEDLLLTTAPNDRPACIGALRAAVSLYRRLRGRLATEALTVHTAAEEAALSYVAEIENLMASSAGPKPFDAHVK